MASLSLPDHRCVTIGEAIKITGVYCNMPKQHLRVHWTRPTPPLHGQCPRQYSHAPIASCDPGCDCTSGECAVSVAYLVLGLVGSPAERKWQGLWSLCRIPRSPLANLLAICAVRGKGQARLDSPLRKGYRKGCRKALRKGSRPRIHALGSIPSRCSSANVGPVR
jgi:hypothetical protein